MTIRVDTMRRIDHLAGVPLCALLSPFVLLFDWLRNLVGQPSASPKKVLFIELSEMGSAILVDPAMRETIKRGAQIYFLIFKSNQVSLELLKTVPNHQVLTIDATGIGEPKNQYSRHPRKPAQALVAIENNMARHVQGDDQHQSV